MIAGQHLSYATYLERLRRLPIDDLLVAEEAGQYPRGVAAAVLVSLENVRAESRRCADDDEPAGGAVAVRGTPVADCMLRGGQRPAGPGGALPGWQPKRDRVLARLAGVSLLTFSVDGSSCRRAPAGDAGDPGEPGRHRHPDAAVCLSGRAAARGQPGSLGSDGTRTGRRVRDLVEQIMALGRDRQRGSRPAATWISADAAPRGWAVAFLTDLGDSTAQAIAIGERLVAD